MQNLTPIYPKVGTKQFMVIDTLVRYPDNGLTAYQIKSVAPDVQDPQREISRLRGRGFDIESIVTKEGKTKVTRYRARLS